ncbi:MAG TPA: hypothetical protein VGE24_08460, partial [Emticicia sp.]
MSRLLLIKTLLAVTILNIPFKAWSQTITITDTNPQIICPGVTLTINFTHANIAQGNVFTVMISDQNGSFVNPLTSTLIQNNTATSATLTIPANATSGSGYYLKVVSSIDYTSDTKPIRIGVPTPYIVNQALYCPDGTITLQVKLSSDTPFPEGYTFQWFKDNVAIANESLSYDTYFKGHAPTNADAGNYQVKASAPAGACSAMSAPVNMLMLASSRTPLVSVSPGTILSGSTATLTATGCSGEVSWYNSYTSYHPTETSYQSPYTFITAEITKDKTYYVSCTENNDCPSAKVPFTVKSDTTQAPQPPSLSASANNFCYSTVSTVTISAAN